MSKEEMFALAAAVNNSPRRPSMGQLIVPVECRYCHEWFLVQIQDSALWKGRGNGMVCGGPICREKRRVDNYLALKARRRAAKANAPAGA